MRSSAGSVSGWSVRWWAPRLSSRARHDAPIRRASGYGSLEQLRQPLRRPAGARRSATAPRASPRPAASADRAAVEPGRAGRGRRLGSGRERRAAAEHEALGERVRGQPVRPVQPGARRTRRPRTGRAASSGRRGRWPRRPSCSAPPGATGTRSRAGSMPTSASAAAMFGKRSTSHVRACRADRPARRVRSQLGLDGERDLVARRQLVHEALALARRSRCAPSPRTASVIEEAVARAVEPQRGGVELHELEVGEVRRPPRCARLQARADRPARVGGALPTARPSRRWRGSRRAREHRRAGRRSRGRSDEPDAAPVGRRRARWPARGSSTSMRSSMAASADSSRVIRRPVAAPPAWTTRRREWPPSRPSARLPWRSASKLHAERLRGRARARATPRTARAPRSRAAASRPAAIVSAACCSGESSSASAAAIPPCAQ